MTVASGTSAGNLPPPTRVGWSVRVCHTSEKPGGRITFRFGLEQNSANDFPDWTWNKDDPARTGYFTSGAYDEKDFPGGLIGPEKIWIKADNDPHGFNSEVCVMFGGVVKQGMTFDKDESHDVKNDESGNCHC